MKNEIQRIQNGLKGFAEEMRAKGIHVGMGRDPRCVTCGEAWPCSTERQGSTR